MAHLIWSPSAVKDLEEICNYISKDSEEDARQFAKKIIDTIDGLYDFPYAGRIVPEIKKKTIREKLINHYRIIYRLKVDTIEIVRIMHSARVLNNLNQ
ncbi:type II toxin-antitoxin system RelE/ParE family toxin [Bacillus sp. Marseille-P3661]|uniref:type II toxin-antitoxin system RelE/ParE family toxin n=1 Tax=Bacillus sp. Marseille-P3661 TaxID=1936234 RepID=UPI000C84B9CE|nr:type II toxin-antitoxin system RelE/ParE family toxin [Bacillus sp. Marseille-P3661]